jgi:hypothetical protein
VTFPINLAPLDPARVAWVLGVLDAGAPIGSRERETIRAALVQLSGLKFAEGATAFERALAIAERDLGT